MLTSERLKEVLTYDPASGVFTWTVDRGGHKVGEVAGHRRFDGYAQIQIDEKRYHAHRLAWYYMTGEWPAQFVDHINGDPSDNRWENLRAATCSQNFANMGPYKTNTSGFKGVTKVRNRWRAVILKDYKRYNIGYFASPEEAARAYDRQAVELFGEFARLNFPSHSQSSASIE